MRNGKADVARIEPLTADELAARGIDPATFLAHFDELPGSVTTLAYRPEILRGTLALWDAVMKDGEVPLALKYMTGYLASMAAGCRYCSAHTASNAAASGASTEQIEALWDYENSPLFTKAERAALHFARLAGLSPSGVEDADMDRLKQFYDSGQIVELLAVIALYGFFNRWNDSLATPLEATPRGFAGAHLAGHGWEVGKHG